MLRFDTPVLPWFPLVLAGLLPGTALGQTELVPIQVTAERSAVSVSDTAAAVTVVTLEPEQAPALTLLPDFLRGQTGVFVQQTTPGQATVILRGLKGSQVLNLVDGMRLNNAFFRPAPNQYLALVDSQWAEHVEVVRGPASVLYGGDAMGGVVQVITRSPRMARERNAEVTLLADSAQHLRSVATSLEWGGERLAGLLMGRNLDTGVLHTGGGRLPMAGYSSRSAFLKLRYRSPSGAEAMFNVQHLRQPSTPRIDELVAGFGQQQPASAVFRFEPNQRDFAHLRGQFSPGWWWAGSVDMHLAWQGIEDSRRTRDTGSNWENREFNRSSLWGWTTQVDVWLGSQRLVYGLELWRDTVASRRFRRNVDTGQWVGRRSRFPDGATMDSDALYAELDGDAGLWHWGAGLRYSRYRVDLPAGDRDEPVRLRPADFSGSLRVRRQLGTALQWVSNLGKGFRPPNVYDLSALGERPGNRYNVANPDLAPEQVYSLDTGLKWQGDYSFAELYLWAARYRDRISAVPTGELTETGRIIVQNRNLGRVNLHGLEAGWRWLQGDNRWQANINWVWGRESDVDGSGPADRIPPLNGLLALDRPWRNTQVRIWLRWAMAQKRLSARDVRDPRIDPDGTPGWATLNLALSGQWSRQWRWSLRLENLLDARYREHGSGLDAPGRNVIVRLEWGS